MKTTSIACIILSAIVLSGCTISGYNDTYTCQSKSGSCGSVSSNIEKSNYIDLNTSIVDDKEITTDEQKPNYENSSREIRVYITPYKDKNGVEHEESFVRIHK